MNITCRTIRPSKIDLLNSVARAHWQNTRALPVFITKKRLETFYFQNRKKIYEVNRNKFQFVYRGNASFSQLRNACANSVTNIIHSPLRG